MVSYDDERDYSFHKDDAEGRCYACRESDQKLLVVRHRESKKLVHLCGDCLTRDPGKFLLDNTRPWKGKKNA